MKITIHIETYTTAAYRAIRPAVIASNIGIFGVCGLTISATIKQSDYNRLIEVIDHAAQSANISHSEYAIITMQYIPQNPVGVKRH